jgi:hypothetical protein
MVLRPFRLPAIIAARGAAHLKRKLINDLVNQCQMITSYCERGLNDHAQEAIDKARKLLDGLEVLCGTRGKHVRKAS